MKRGISLLLLTACAGMGCMSLPSWWEKPTAPTVANKPVRSRPLVSADQITESNAKEMAGVLVDELDRDAQSK